MVATTYYVSWYLHNKENDGWAYKVENKYADLDSAKKSYHALLGNYVGSTVYDSVAVILTDSYGNTIMKEWWSQPEIPAEEA